MQQMCIKIILGSPSIHLFYFYFSFVILYLVTDIVNNCLRTGVVNISYEVVRGSVQNLSEVEGALADPGQDFISDTGSVILQDGQTSVAIPVTILEVNARCFLAPFLCLLKTSQDSA